MKQHVETQDEWEEKKGNKILAYIADELIIELPFFEAALHGLSPVGAQGLMCFATDGIDLFFPAKRYIDIFKTNELFLKRAYLHTVLHCIYGQLWLINGRDKKFYNLACDIAVEYVIDGLKNTGLGRPLTWNRQKLYTLMKEKKAYSVGDIYKLLIFDVEESELPVLAQEFFVDDHSRWWDENDKQAMSMPRHQAAKEKWQQIADKVSQQKNRTNTSDDAGINSMLAEAVAKKKKKSYREFLLQFSTLLEQPVCDEDEMDLALYLFGLDNYGNIPIIEPLEVKEAKSLREFVIAIDTSYSTSGELVRNFLSQTLTILMEENIYNSQTKVHLLQCDSEIRDYRLITDLRNVESIFRSIKLKGGGNTDFRPVFSYVKRLQEEGKAGQIDGIIYFTDGKGIFPKQKPEYKTAFVFEENYDIEAVPGWVIQYEYSRSEK